MYSKKILAAQGVRPHIVTAFASFLGDDICIAVGGGTHKHIGAVALAVYEPLRDSATVSCVSVHSHRDDAVAAYFAKAVSREMKCTVTVSAGLHVDDAAEEDIRILKENSAKCCDELISMLKNAVEVK